MYLSKIEQQILNKINSGITKKKPYLNLFDFTEKLIKSSHIKTSYYDIESIIQKSKKPIYIIDIDGISFATKKANYKENSCAQKKTCRTCIHERSQECPGSKEICSNYSPCPSARLIDIYHIARH